MVKIGENGIFRKKTSKRFQESKIVKFGFDFAEKSRIEVERNFGTTKIAI